MPNCDSDQQVTETTADKVRKFVFVAAIGGMLGLAAGVFIYLISLPMRFFD